MKNFKLYFYLILTVILVQSCSVKTQKTALSGLTDEVYFTPSDTRISMSSKDLRENNEDYSRQTIQQQRNQAGDFSSSYANRIRYFNSANTFVYNPYQPVIFTQNLCNPYTGRNMMNFMDQGQMFYGNSFSNPFSPNYGIFGYSEDFWDQMHFYNFSMYNYFFPYKFSYCAYNPFFYNQFNNYSLLNNYYINQNNNQKNNTTNYNSNNNQNNNNNNNNSSGPWYRSNSDGSSSGSSRPTTNGGSSSGESPKRR